MLSALPAILVTLVVPFVAARLKPATKPVTVLAPAPAKLIVSPSCAVPLLTVIAVVEVIV